ncbi:LytTR family DNA-binding domain-containing protein [Pedobacter sp. BMA]|uniref:LytR/AlgR family response regulator transcription factor n=1 Tax=Pedobacter sp. BMA TaxID=1663685 RepID=UPI0006498692|nr:LytTR family DNA-binding domain-containing protein [Pedobacter sp. BMA]KLT64042.1 hypothetical protein AB669_18430 [Pedobacter sp. BMA]
MLPYKCVVIDDDDSAISILTDYIGVHPRLVLHKTFTDPTSALADISVKDQVDFLFVDIDMPDITGIDLAKRLWNKVRFIVFVTAFNQHAIQAIALNASGYLLKPISKVQFTQVIADTLDHERKIVEISKREDPNSFFVANGERNSRSRIKKEDILYIEGCGNFVKIVTNENTELVYLTMKETETGLGGNPFFRIHNSYIINAEKVLETTGNLVYIGEIKIGLSKAFRDNYLIYLDRNTLRSDR